MLNRVIYGGQVYYKVNDVAVLFELSQYKMKKVLEKQGIEKGKLAGFGRTLFILEKNVGKIEIGGEVTIIETKFEESITKQSVQKSDEVPAEETKNEKETVKSETENEVETSVNNNDNESNTEGIEELQKEHEYLMTKGKALGVKLHKAGKGDLLHEICDKHMGKGNNFVDGTLEDMKAMKATVSELEVVVAETQLSA
ncbi:hypothetical protein [Bacillus mycoides]|uniref:hypothetical protein n=1 Tax=Bacillus mycoides TaxID=1405 RepID=UPI000A27AF40|nr:hypothetical protein [Bacillus mycoides]OSY03797.1 hypothetical protein BTJ44_05121 [Bacillus mycoides]